MPRWLTGLAFAAMGQHERANPLAGSPMDGERNVAAHRQSADDGALDAKRPQQRQYIVCVIVHRRRRRPRRFAEVAQVGRDEPPAVERRGMKRRPHVGAERKGVQENDGRACAGLQPGQPSTGDFDVAAGHTGFYPCAPAPLRF